MQHNLIRTTFLAVLTSIAAIINTSDSHAGGHDHSDAAIGEPDDAARIMRTVRIDMTGAMRSVPAQITIQYGETICFEVINNGQVWYEMTLDTPAGLVAHAEQVRKYPGVEHADANAVTADPGQHGEIVWHFTHVGSIEFACLQPGRFEAGMRGAVQVRGNKPRPLPNHLVRQGAQRVSSRPDVGRVAGRRTVHPRDGRRCLYVCSCRCRPHVRRQDQEDRHRCR